ncbi:TetR/AcrR family transcriptional regulator [Kitasatospora sp. NPDC088346]|uniref:TetR/AcrR family transcriptional regulator n=1 Tax=Kitasatospora sp. NPDC088346 TaxID=3364073 RepID=UPI00381C87E2
MTAKKSARVNATDRRAGIVDAAIEEFAAWGLAGASIERVAARVGISQPYVYRLFSSKKELFLAALDEITARISTAFTDAVDGRPADEALTAMGEAYLGLLARRSEPLMLLQGIATGADEETRARVRDNFRTLTEQVRNASGASEPEVRHFFAFGMLATVGTAIDMPELAAPAETFRPDNDHKEN